MFVAVLWARYKAVSAITATAMTWYTSARKAWLRQDQCFLGGAERGSDMGLPRSIN